MAIDARVDELCVNTMRTLSMDAVQQANSGHPGTAMALAPVDYCLWQRFLRFDPDDPIWPNRDRFVLSIGHASMLLYSMLHLCGVKAVNAKYERLGELSVMLDDIKRVRQLDSKCPGHPEYRWTSGIETTTGPLGQGVATSGGAAGAAGATAAGPGVRGATAGQTAGVAQHQGVGLDHVAVGRESRRPCSVCDQERDPRLAGSGGRSRAPSEW